ncbi:uncharacterized protein TNCV_4961801 [Trichonephila clavipes]|nr:uncharacterized protein TNCV_4961801 [Trichonephila clavipes]
MNTDLWTLDTLGITYPSVKESQIDLQDGGINSLPCIYITEYDATLMPLNASLFLQGYQINDVPDFDVAAVAEWYRYRTVACFVTGSSPVPLKTRRVGQRCTLNLSRAETSSRWCGVVVRRGGCQLRCRPRHLTMVQNYVVRRQKPSCS